MVSFLSQQECYNGLILTPFFTTISDVCETRIFVNKTSVSNPGVGYCIYGLLLILGVNQLTAQAKTHPRTYLYKSLAGAASEFPSFTPPSLEDSAMHSRYYVLPPLTLENSSQKWTHSFPVDKCDIFTVTIFATDPKSFTLKFLSPDDEKVANEIYDENIGYGPGGSYPCRTYLFEDPISLGEWHITVTSDHSFYPVNVGIIASFYPSDLILQAFVPTENLIVGKSIDIIALLPMSIGLQKTSNSTLSIATLENAITKIYLPDGNEERIKLEEGPSHSIRNVKRGNGVRSLYASFEVKEAGMYKSLVEVSGKLSDGTNFIRSLWYVFTIAHPSINITGNVKGSLHTHNISQRDKIDFDIDVNWDESDLSYRAFAQVWSTGENKEDVPIAWISGLVDVQKREDCLSNCYYIHMELDSRWLELANVRQPLVLTLKSVTLEELRAYITLTRSDALEVTADDKLMKWSPSLRAKDIEIDWEMKEGYNPYRVKMHNVTETGKLLLLHGFCAGCNNPFQLEYFDDYILFEDHNKNYLHDEYARKVYDHIMDKGATRLSVYGHSQGGAVALHLYTYYFTAIDASKNGRVVQSLGTPYRGSPLAGILAYLADLLFGYGCGANEDLTYCGANEDLTYCGAEEWLCGIPLDRRAAVYYYTTQYPKDVPYLQRYCSLVTDLVLSPDNDGMVEVERGKLEGGVLVENAEGECHMRDMRYPAQLDNIERSKEINDKAAR